MHSQQLLDLVLKILEDMKGQDIVALDVRHLTDVMDFMVVCSGTSNRHTRAVAEHIIVDCKAKGVMPFGVEGQEFGDWILVDLGDIVVHIMLPETREFYSLEKLWSTTARAEGATRKKAKKDHKDGGEN